MLLRINLILLICISVFASNLFAANNIKATRIWPAPDYTRITIESSSKINNDQMMLQNPDRIVIDLKEIRLTQTLKGLMGQIKPDDPNIQGIRVAQFNPKVSRIVIDLKNSAHVKIFSLPPITPYQHRLVIDIYPKDKDDIANLLKQLEDKQTKSSQKISPKIGLSTNENDVLTPKELLVPEKKQVTQFIVVAIDAGHGGEDPGAKGRKGTKEKKITLKIAKILKRLIDQEANMKAVLIRNGDYYIPLKKRVSKARKVKADIFISIHADAFRKRNVRGSSVFALSERGATSAFAKFLANKENESDLIGGVSIDDKEPILARTLLDLSQSATINDSLRLGNYVLKEIKKVNKLHKKRVEQAGFAVLKAPDIPSILVETAFLSNPKEEKNLRSKKFQTKLAKGILRGIKKYIKSGVSFAFNSNQSDRQ
jgi:N-acetylmuramoyl-L-alanine amidase